MKTGTPSLFWGNPLVTCPSRNTIYTHVYIYIPSAKNVRELKHETEKSEIAYNVFLRSVGARTPISPMDVVIVQELLLFVFSSSF